MTCGISVTNQTGNDLGSAQKKDTPKWTSNLARVLNILAAPGDVMDEVLQRPVNLVNWRLPTLLVCFSAMLTLPLRLQGDLGVGGGLLAGAIAVVVAAIAGSIWSALIVWSLGRFCLQSRFPFPKTLELAGLISTILALGHLVTALLIVASGDPAAAPSALWFFAKIPTASIWHPILEMPNLFYLWTVGLLGLALSKLSRVSFKEALFWVGGYWVLFRGALLLLA